MSDFIICTRDFSGLGMAIRLQDEGHDVLVAYEPDPEMPDDKVEAYNLVGKGIVKRSTMKAAFEKRKELKDCYWVFDSNYLYEYGDKLRKEGFKVFGASEWTNKMEFDREFGTNVAKSSGLDLPETKEFSDVASAIEFLEAHDEQSYVCKPNDVESYLTYVPQMEIQKDANRELQSYLQLMDDGHDFILQEQINGVEVDVNVLFHNGKPYFATVLLECKRKNSGDKGELVGCSQDIIFTMPLESPIVQKTIGKMFPVYQKQKYTGFGDVNCILADNSVYFLEVCNRFGYNEHPNLFWNLCIPDFSEVLSQMVDEPKGNFYENFRKGFGASILLYIDHSKSGFPLFVAKETYKNFYSFDSYKDETCEEETDYRLAGYDIALGIVTGFGYTIKDAAKHALDNALKINYPFCAYREDLDDVNYHSSPIKRYEALSAMGLLV
jgi:phosphoribosylamine-glycine ligase